MILAPCAPQRARLLATASLAAFSLAVVFSAPAARAERGEKLVTWEDIANDDKSTNDVLTYGLGLGAHRYSTLDKINVDNVGKLKAKWAFSFGDERQRGQEGQSLVHDGVIYVTGSYSRIFALDAMTGKRLWAHSHRLAEDIRPCCDVVNRGAAIYGDKIYMGTLDASIIALDRKTGKVAWQKKFEDHTAGYTMTGAPAFIKDQKTGKVLLIHGSSGDEFGVVGRLYARDPDTGEEIWMRPLVEGHMGRLNGKDSTPTGDPKAPSWPNNPDGTKKDAWNHGGGAPWQTATFDVKSNTIVIGTGNPAPWNYHHRSGPNGDWKPYDSLFTSGQIYIEPSTGEVVGFFQHTPNDAWDFSGNNSVLLFDLEKDGKKIRAAAHADRNGYFFITDLDKLTARDGRLSKQAGSAIAIYPFVKDISWATGWDVAAGRPIEGNGRPPAPLEGEKQGQPVKVTPNFLGGTNWMPMSYNPETKLFYIPSNDWMEDYWTENLTYKKGAAYLGQGFRIKRKFEDHVGALRALDPATGKIVWEALEPMPLWAGTLTTKGNLVFTGTSDGFVKAFNAKTGQELWKFQTGSGVVSIPVTWEQDGKQYLGISSGYGGAVPLWGGDMADMTKTVSQGGSYWVFELSTDVADAK
ncbi:PQQ-dependent dehydrogenase, methanol/ethanol family [Rhodoblastus sphagnicola]|uniref:PQQ-dependent dehydrogenase, methanol/ethanol family n=1 Tax=Rhodoblastus sphagnicola TaxID=333368 RepID=A0A2S6MX69_9HYPH|nr:methanol/ethanol family PQQ-dependent dehydrogenase [Rhodoblastus sphagnicola]MBB4199296.1 alcohol dehydrogenase (cytochrome c) [Rhodoblastus sphagnicola]PPQ26964.1 PQQ-dependent dehydrogenase, methanol/ethanol family [Rhodoblastus sphagnicola]